MAVLQRMLGHTHAVCDVFGGASSRDLNQVHSLTACLATVLAPAPPTADR